MTEQEVTDMKKTIKAVSATFAALVMALVFSASANAGGPHVSLDVRLPLPPLPPIPVPFGFIDVNGAAYGHAPRVYTPGYVYYDEYRPAYRPAYRHHRYERRVNRDWRHDRWRERGHDRGRWRH